MAGQDILHDVLRHHSGKLKIAFNQRIRSTSNFLKGGASSDHFVHRGGVCV